jgi:hypothetical protein
MRSDKLDIVTQQLDYERHGGGPVQELEEKVVVWQAVAHLPETALVEPVASHALVMQSVHHLEEAGHHRRRQGIGYQQESIAVEGLALLFGESGELHTSDRV